MKKISRVMVCVTGQKTCERLIRAGADIAEENSCALVVVHVAKTGFTFLGNSTDGDALEYLFEISKQFNADMSVLRADDEIEALCRQAEQLRASHIVMGSPPKSVDHRIHKELSKQLKKVKFHIIEP
ncbi:MAG: universal stress protein [Christensenellales bacterium]|jgi:K+-sensing histidine kinase KdpD